MSVATRAPSAVGRGMTGVSGAVWTIARREFRDAMGSRWFLLFTIAFAALSAGVSFMSLAGVGSLGFAGFGRTAAGLLNLVMLVVPLMGIVAGAGSIAGERERGTLTYLLSQPVSRVEVMVGKYVGLAIALSCSICIGLGLSAGVLAWRSGGAGISAYLTLVGMTCLLGLASLSVGMAISAVARRNGVAMGVGLFVWLALVFLSDLGLMAGGVLFKLRVQELFALGIVNPLQAFKMGVIVGMNASLDVLGPVGVYASRTFGGWLMALLPGVVVLWAGGGLLLAAGLFVRRSGV